MSLNIVDKVNCLQIWLLWDWRDLQVCLGHMSFQFFQFGTISGITLSHVKTRKAPNAFNFLRQLEILQKNGNEDDNGCFSVPCWQIKKRLILWSLWVVLCAHVFIDSMLTLVTDLWLESMACSLTFSVGMSTWARSGTVPLLFRKPSRSVTWKLQLSSTCWPKSPRMWLTIFVVLSEPGGCEHGFPTPWLRRIYSTLASALHWIHHLKNGVVAWRMAKIMNWNLRLISQLVFFVFQVRCGNDVFC